MESKKITVQVWTDLYYSRTIGIWYPPAPTITEPSGPISPLEQKQEKPNDAPFIIVLSGMYQPRSEVLGNNPVAPGQHPIPKDFLQKQVRAVCTMFANNQGVFQPHSKATAKTFLAKQTISYKKIKEVKIDVSPVQGSITLKELRDSIDQYTEEEQNNMLVMTAGENPEDTKDKHIDKFIYSDKQESTQQYITITKLNKDFYPVDPYIKKDTVPSNPADALPPQTENAPASQPIINEMQNNAQTDAMNREALKTSDKMKDNTTSTSPTPQPTREEVLEQMIKEKDDKLIKAGLMEPPLEMPEDPQNPPK